MKVRTVWCVFTFLVQNSLGIFCGGGGITYQLYTQTNKVNGQPLVYLNSYTLSESTFDNSLPTRILIHGWGQNGRSNINRLLKNAFITRGDYNIIVVDWYPVSSPFYTYAVNKVATTGMAVSKFIKWLNPNMATLHLIGFDIGAHVAGIAGRNLKSEVGKIIGLDPARQQFSMSNVANILTKNDAVLVEIFHSSGAQYGFYEPYGDIDYYINNGQFQTGCANHYCSHYQSVIVYSRIVSGDNDYTVVPCNDIAEVATGCLLDPIDILLDEISPSGIYQIKTSSAEAINTEVETLS